ncbi:unnamed protein product [Cylicocyclus nassatus]|uniref:Uncharacterized protein n=1 Tax=Cylicocyclus nassatus TaxID=53992 RepID=A0AA36MBN3_CYLNA|nr:unnamed protein product [Cylicocyclus nassatus]
MAMLLILDVAVEALIVGLDGLKLIAGQTFADQTVQCPNSGAQCYNMSASAAGVLDVVKAGCSLWRCMLARDRCISTTFQNIPISLCCCSTHRCNVGNTAIGGFQKQAVSGWNAAPDREVKQMTHAQMRSQLESADLDDEVLSTTRGNRHSAQTSRLSPATQESDHSTFVDIPPSTQREARHSVQSKVNATSRPITTAQNLTGITSRGNNSFSHSADEIEILLE